MSPLPIVQIRKLRKMAVKNEEGLSGQFGSERYLITRKWTVFFLRKEGHKEKQIIEKKIFLGGVE